MSRVTRILATELPPDADNPEPWSVEYVVDGRVQRQRHDSKRAAQRHVGNLLKEADGDVLTVKRRA